MKRLFDLAVAVPAIVLLSPLLLVLGCSVAAVLGRPVLFRQQRPGLCGKPFTILKFRTMVDARGPDGSLLPDEERLPGFGRWLRSTSLDELPELWNVIVGDMSIVGPRPLLMQYLPHYSERQAIRHLVRPGLTGWAQVKGRNAVSWDKRLEMDAWYVENWNLALDARIIATTLLSVIRRHGISAEGSATMPEFAGSSADAREEPVDPEPRLSAPDERRGRGLNRRING
jgi:lipopolysaccharide/colanic/teichoic acid biosynthesis glycosyltransferase